MRATHGPALLMAATAGLLSVVLIQAVVGFNPVVYLDVDPRYEPHVLPIMVFGPTALIVLSIVSVLIAALGIAAHVAAGGRVRWLASVLVLIGCTACICQMPRHFDNLIRCSQWLSAVCVALAAVHLAEHDRPRRLIAAALVAMLLPLALDAVWFVLREQPQAVNEYLNNEDSLLKSKGWVRDSPFHKMFNRRMLGGDATGAFALSNIFGSITASWTALAVTLTAGLAARRSLSMAMVMALLVAAGLVCVGLSLSKGAMVALLIAVCLIAAVCAVGRRHQAVLRRILAPVAIGLVSLAIIAVLVRGSMGSPSTPEGPRSMLFRYYYWQASAAMMAEASWSARIAGLGPNGFDQAYAVYKNPLNPEEVDSAHNVLIDYTVMLGVGGAAWCLLLLAWLWRGATRAAWAFDTTDQPTVLPGDSPFEIRPNALGWAAIVMAMVFIGELLFEFEKMLGGERLVVWTLAVGGFVTVVAMLQNRQWMSTRWMNLGLLAAAVVLLVHNQIEMSFFHNGSVTLAWFMIAVAAARPAADVGQEMCHARGYVLVALLVVVAWLGPGWHAPAVIAHQDQLASASRALRGKRLAVAIDHLDRAIEAMPIDPAPYRWQARLRLQEADVLARQYQSVQARQRIDRALAAFDRAAAAGLDDMAMLRWRISLYDRAALWLEEPEYMGRAIALVDQLLEKSPFSVDAHRFAADLYWGVGWVKEARRLYHRCLELNEFLWLDPLRQLNAADRQLIEKRVAGAP